MGTLVIWLSLLAIQKEKDIFPILWKQCNTHAQSDGVSLFISRYKYESHSYFSARLSIFLLRSTNNLSRTCNATTGLLAGYGREDNEAMIALLKLLSITLYLTWLAVICQRHRPGRKSTQFNCVFWFLLFTVN